MAALNCREAWLIVASGGWWKQSEILAFLPDESRVSDLHVRLRFMHRKGYLERREVPTDKRERVHPKGVCERLEYAVTMDCKVPQGVTAGAVMKAIAGEVMA